MAEVGILKRRPRGLRGRHGKRMPLRIAAMPATAGGAPIAGDRPRLGFREPESVRGAWISGSIATAVHVAIVASFALIAWLAPEVIEEVLIPVQIMNEPIEAPGSNQAAPKALAPRRPAAQAALAARAMDTVAQQAPRPVPSQIPAQALQTARLNPAQAPRQIDRRQLQAQRLDVAQNVDAPRAMDIATLSPRQVARTNVAAPRAINTAAPRAINSAATAAPVAPDSFRNFAAVSPDAYRAQAMNAPTAVAVQEGGTAIEGAAVALSDRMVGGGGRSVNGTGGDIGAVPCMESAYVQRYLDEVKARTVARWDVPEGTQPKVVLELNLDTSGSASDIAVVDTPDASIGRSAVLALRTAAPFSPMNKNNRCLAEIRLRMNFDTEL